MLEDLRPAAEENNSCKVIKRVKEHPDTTDKDLELVREYLDDPDWGHYQLSSALRAKGIDVHKDSILRHRQGRCPCSMT